MVREKLAVIDQGTFLAESMLGNGSALRILIAGGQNKNAVLTEVVARLENDSMGQASFLRTIFQNIGKEGDIKVTNRRDAAVAILTDSSLDGEVHLNAVIAPLIKDNSVVARASYIEAVQEQTGENDPFSGSIDALLEVGKAIASYLNQDGQGRGKVIGAWEEIADKFRETDQRSQIHLKLEEIKQRMIPISDFDIQVEELSNRGLNYSEIAGKLGKSKPRVAKSVRLLIDVGRIKPGSGKIVRQATVRFDEDVAELSRQGFNNTQIAKRFGKSASSVDQSVRRLVAAGKLERGRGRGAPVSESTRQLDVKVKRLREDELNNYQIAEKLKRKRAEIDDSIRRLLATGQTERRWGGKRKNSN